MAVSLSEHKLLGPVGSAKRFILSLARNIFYGYANSLPQTDDLRVKAAHAAVDVLDAGASIAGSIGGGAVEEAILLFKQALTIRLRRGY